MNSCREIGHFMFCLQILVKKYHLPLIKKFHEYLWGGSKKIIHTPPQNILEGNGVVYRNFTFNSLLLQVFTCYFYIILFKLFHNGGHVLIIMA